MSELVAEYCVNVLKCGNYAAPNSIYCFECQEQRNAYRKPDRTEQIYNRLTTKPGRELPKRKEHK